MWGKWRRAATCTLGAVLTVLVLAGNAGAVAITEHSAGLGSGHWPAFITSGPDGNLWFTFWSCGGATGACGLGRVTPNATITEFTAGLPTQTFPTAITSGADGNLWFVDAPEGGSTPAIGRITPAGAISESASAVESGTYPIDIASGPDGNLWFTAVGIAPEITRLTPAGGVTHFSAPSSVLPTDDTLRSITPGPGGSLWFTDPGPAPLIGRIATNGAIRTFPLSAGSSVPADIVAAPDGNVWFTDHGATPAVVRMTPAGATTAFSVGLSPGATPDAITAGPDGNLWFTETGSRERIGRITPGGVITEFSTGLSADSTLRDITSGPDGNIWFTDQACNGRPTARCAIGQLALQLPPAVANGDSTGISAMGAQISGTVNPLGGAVSRIVVRYQVGHGTPRFKAASPVSLPASGKPVAISATLTGLPPQQTITYAIQATNAFGTTTGPTRTLRTSRGPAPTILGFAQSHRRWRRGTHLASISRRRSRPPVGTTFSFRLNEAAALQVQFSRVRSGRRVGRRCLVPSSQNRHRPRCTRLRGAGTLRFSGHSGRNRIRFEGRLNARHSIANGTYQVRIVATAFGTSRRSRALTFEVVAR